MTKTRQLRQQSKARKRNARAKETKKMMAQYKRLNKLHDARSFLYIWLHYVGPMATKYAQKAFNRFESKRPIQAARIRSWSGRISKDLKLV